MGSRIVVGLGAGGHVKALIELVRTSPDLKLEGLVVASPSEAARTVLGVPVLGDESSFPLLRARGVSHFFVGIGSVGDNRARRDAFLRAREAGLEPVSLVHPSAVVSRSARLGAGCTVMAGAIVGAEATLGSNALINSAALVEHDTTIGSHAHVSIGARLAGNVAIGEGAYVGAGAVVLEGRAVGEYALVAAGAVVLEDVIAGQRVAGVPARPLVDACSPGVGVGSVRRASEPRRA